MKAKNKYFFSAKLCKVILSLNLLFIISGCANKNIYPICLVPATNSYCALVSETGDLILPPDDFSPLSKSNNFWVFRGEGGNISVLNNVGQIVIQKGRFEYLGEFSEGLWPARELHSDAMGFVDSNGAWVIGPKKYASMGSFNEGLAPIVMYNPDAVEEPGWHGYLDKSGKSIISILKSGYGESFKDDLAIIHEPRKNLIRLKDDYQGLINKKGKEIFPLKFQKISWFDKNLWLIGTLSESTGGVVKYQIVNKKGEVIYSSMNPEYKPISLRNHKLIDMKLINEDEEIFYVIDLDNKNSIRELEQNTKESNFNSEGTPVRVYGRYQYFNSNGELSTAGKFIIAEPFCGKRALAINEDRGSVLMSADKVLYVDANERISFASFCDANNPQTPVFFKKDIRSENGGPIKETQWLDKNGKPLSRLIYDVDGTRIENQYNKIIWKENKKNSAP